MQKNNLINHFKDIFGISKENTSDHTTLSTPNFNKDLGELQSIVSRAAIGAAKSQAKIKSNLEQIKKASKEIENSTSLTKTAKGKLDEVTKSSSTAAETSKKTSLYCVEGQNVSAAALKSAQELSVHMEHTFERISSLVKNIQGVSEISKTIQDVALQTKLLSFNASVEAARAGEHGKGFSIVAREIQKLGENTARETKTIMDLLEKINHDLDPSSEALTISKKLAASSSLQSIELNSFFEKISQSVIEVTNQLQSIAESCVEQKTSIDITYESMKETQQHAKEVERNTEELDRHTKNLSNISETAFTIFGKYDVGTFFNQTVQRAHDLVKKHEHIILQVINEGKCQLSDVLNYDYIEINANHFQLVSHLFKIHKAPFEGFNPPKYIKKYEPLVDLKLQNICEDILQIDKRYKFIIFVDINCHATTHNKIFSQDWSGNYEADFLNNRIKRFFDNNEVLLRASRVGLKNQEKIPARASRAMFMQHSGNLKMTPENKNSYLVQTYTRDTGEVMSVLSMPTFVKSERVGAILFGWVDD